ncbi:hypothetical protein [Mycolicibacterium sp. CR10]|uniref:hypothetical protein n=1 Tax=Mycolicibacterium sp. CR10 TaxID=2562314 RepID=UPI0010C10327|nr:hypothetical protein [Mycolicibacterium sp. CR10]
MMAIVNRCKARVDPAAVERIEKDRVARATAERIAILRHNVFRNAEHSRDVDALTNESGAARLLTAAHNNANSFLVLGILRTAIDNRWHHVVQAGISHFEDHPVSDRIQELWDLTTARSEV